MGTIEEGIWRGEMALVAEELPYSGEQPKKNRSKKKGGGGMRFSTWDYIRIFGFGSIWNSKG